MILSVNSANFTDLLNGYYVSTAFKINNLDTFVAIEVVLPVNGLVSMQNSINGSTWYDIENTEFACNPAGLQAYLECSSDLYYRIKANQLPISANILI